MRLFSLILMACRNKCERFELGIEANYSSGKKYCRRCEVFLYHDGFFCPCCGMALRHSPTSRLSREKLRIRRLDNANYPSVATSIQSWMKQVVTSPSILLLEKWLKNKSKKGDVIWPSLSLLTCTWAATATTSAATRLKWGDSSTSWKAEGDIHALVPYFMSARHRGLVNVTRVSIYARGMVCTRRITASKCLTDWEIRCIHE